CASSKEITIRTRWARVASFGVQEKPAKLARLPILERQVGNFAKLDRLIRCGNRPENGHATLDNSHPWRGRFVPCRSFRCLGPAEIWPGRGVGRSRGCDVRRLPTFIQTPPPTACSICIGSPAARCALGAAPRRQHTATRR